MHYETHPGLLVLRRLFPDQRTRRSVLWDLVGEVPDLVVYLRLSRGVKDATEQDIKEINSFLRSLL
jgi:hypothetical protein